MLSQLCLVIAFSKKNKHLCTFWIMKEYNWCICHICILILQTGQFQLLEQGAMTPSSMIMYQIHTEGASITATDISSSYQCMAYGDNGGKCNQREVCTCMHAHGQDRLGHVNCREVWVCIHWEIWVLVLLLVYAYIWDCNCRDVMVSACIHGESWVLLW